MEPNKNTSVFLKHYDKSNWKKVRLGDVSTMFSGGTPSVDNKAFYNNGSIPFIRSGEIAAHQTELHITEEALNNSSAKMVQCGDLLLALYGATSGKVAISNITGAINQAILCIRSQIFSPAFLYHFLTYNQTYIISTFLQGGQGNLSAEIIKGLYVDVPTASEQNKISNTLSKIDLHIERLEKLISKQEAIKKTTLKLLLAPRSNWQEIKLGDICSITTGKLDANAMSPHGKYAFFTCAKEVYKINNYAFDTEALLVSGNGSHVGYVHYYKGKFNAYQRTYVLDKFTANILFVKYFLDCKLSQRIDAEKKSGNTPYILRDTLYDMKLTIPVSITEQERIATQLSEIDAHIENLKEQLAKQRAIKQGLMDYFFGN